MRSWVLLPLGPVAHLARARRLDLFVLSKDQRKVTLWLWDRSARSPDAGRHVVHLVTARTAAYAFRPSPAAPIEAPSGFVITNVVPGDYNYDGRLDILLMGQFSPGSWTGSGDLKMAVYFGTGSDAFCVSRSARLIASYTDLAQPRHTQYLLHPPRNHSSSMPTATCVSTCLLSRPGRLRSLNFGRTRGRPRLMRPTPSFRCACGARLVHLG